MKINYKKSLKMITLLITSILIAAVSAQVYSYMYIEGSGEITTLGGMKWEKGTTAPAGATIDGYYVRTLNLSIPKNTFKNFTDCLRLINNDTGYHTFSVEITEVGGNTTKFTTFNLAVYNSTDTYANLDIKTKESATGLYISGGATMYIRFEVDPGTDETSGYMYFTVKLTYE